MNYLPLVIIDSPGPPASHPIPVLGLIAVRHVDLFVVVGRQIVLGVAQDTLERHLTEMTDNGLAGRTIDTRVSLIAGPLWRCRHFINCLRWTHYLQFSGCCRCGL